MSEDYFFSTFRDLISLLDDETIRKISDKATSLAQACYDVNFNFELLVDQIEVEQEEDLLDALELVEHQFYSMDL